MYGEQVNTEDFDRDAREQSEAPVVNISDEPFRFEIATQPGSKPRRYVLAPYGQEGSTIHLQIGYTLPYKGAGRGMVRPTIESISEREIVAEIPAIAGVRDGRPAIRVPLVVHHENASAARSRYVAALEAAGKSPRQVREAAANRPATVTPARITDEPMHEDVEDQGGALDEPPPDDDTPPEPVTVGARKGKA